MSPPPIEAALRRTDTEAKERADVAPWQALRARQWWYFAAAPLAAQPDSLAALPPAVLAAALALGYGFGLNAITDRATDRDQVKNPLAGLESPHPSVAAWVLGAAAAAAGMAWLLGPFSATAMAVSLLASTLYSVGPRLKGRPLWGAVANAAIFTPLLGLGGSALAPLLPAVGAFALLLTQNQLIHEVADRAEDEERGDRTTARTLGPRRTWWVAISLGPLAALAVLAVPAMMETTAGSPTSTERLVGGVAVLLGSAVIALGDPSRARSVRRAHRAAAALGCAAVVLAGWLA